jgi:hypothetical protein
MSKSKNLLHRGNGKLGEAIHTWTIPPVDTCPGATPICLAHCYARGGRFRTHHMGDLMQANLDASLQSDFENRMVKEVKRRGVHVLRVHVSGDFYDPAYAMKWVRIARRSKHTTFYCYTRSWRLPEFAEVLGEMAGLKNWKLWFSTDDDSGSPEHVPDGVRLAYMQTEADNEPDTADLVFRIPGLRDTQQRRLGLTVICPTENGAASSNDKSCTNCRRCYS